MANNYLRWNIMAAAGPAIRTGVPPLPFPRPHFDGDDFDAWERENADPSLKAARKQLAKRQLEEDLAERRIRGLSEGLGEGKLARPLRVHERAHPAAVPVAPDGRTLPPSNARERECHLAKRFSHIDPVTGRRMEGPLLTKRKAREGLPRTILLSGFSFSMDANLIGKLLGWHYYEALVYTRIVPRLLRSAPYHFLDAAFVEDCSETTRIRQIRQFVESRNLTPYMPYIGVAPQKLKLLTMMDDPWTQSLRMRLPTLSDDELVDIFVQVAAALSFVDVAGGMHNAVGLDTVLLREVPPRSMLHYRHGTSVWTLQPRFRAMLFDWEQAFFPELGENPFNKLAVFMKGMDMRDFFRAVLGSELGLVTGAGGAGQRPLVTGMGTGKQRLFEELFGRPMLEKVYAPPLPHVAVEQHKLFSPIVIVLKLLHKRTELGEAAMPHSGEIVLPLIVEDPSAKQARIIMEQERVNYEAQRRLAQKRSEPALPMARPQGTQGHRRPAPQSPPLARPQGPLARPPLARPLSIFELVERQKEDEKRAIERGAALRRASDAGAFGERRRAEAALQRDYDAERRRAATFVASLQADLARQQRAEDFERQAARQAALGREQRAAWEEYFGEEVEEEEEEEEEEERP